jgi:hypothetical protein
MKWLSSKNPNRPHMVVMVYLSPLHEAYKKHRGVATRWHWRNFCHIAHGALFDRSLRSV